jgi:hypothetical protein
MKPRLKLTGMFHSLPWFTLLYNFHSGFTTQEKGLYARMLDLIPILAPVIEECTDKEKAFEQFVKLVR